MCVLASLMVAHSHLTSFSMMKVLPFCLPYIINWHYQRIQSCNQFDSMNKMNVKLNDKTFRIVHSIALSFRTQREWWEIILQPSDFRSVETIEYYREENLLGNYALFLFFIFNRINQFDKLFECVQQCERQTLDVV